MRVVGVLNRDGGTLRTADLDRLTSDAKAAFAAHGHALEVRVVGGRDLLPALRAAVQSGADLLLAGGGDGTISAAAELCFRSGMPLAVLPAGTMNLFARSLGIPLDLGEALDALAAGEIGAVDIATANGQVFVHQYSVGIYARLVRLREQMSYRSRLGKIWATTKAMIGALTRPPRFWVEIATADGTERRRVSAIIVSNNPVGDGHIPYADRLDSGHLGIYVAQPLNSFALLVLMLRVMAGRWRGAPEVSDSEYREVILAFPRRKRSAQAVIDGELMALADRVDIKVQPGALKVMLPGRPTAAGS